MIGPKFTVPGSTVIIICDPELFNMILGLVSNTYWGINRIEPFTVVNPFWVNLLQLFNREL